MCTKVKKKQRHATNEKPNIYINIYDKENLTFFVFLIKYNYMHIWFLVCCVALFLLCFVIINFDARIKRWFYRSTLIQQQYLCQWLTYSTPNG